MLRLIAAFTLVLVCAGCQAGATAAGPARADRNPHIPLWGPPDNSGGNGAGGGGGGM